MADDRDLAEDYDEADEGGAVHGSTRNNIERTDDINNQGQGAKTLQKNREMARSGSPDQGTH